MKYFRFTVILIGLFAVSSSAAQFKSVRFLDELALTHSKDFFVSPEEGKTPNPPVHFPEHQCLQYWFRMIREEKMAPSPTSDSSLLRSCVCGLTVQASPCFLTINWNIIIIIITISTNLSECRGAAADFEQISFEK